MAVVYDQQAILDKLEVFRASLRAEGRTNDEDVVLEVMDMIAGWVSPPLQIASSNTAAAVCVTVGGTAAPPPRYGHFCIACGQQHANCCGLCVYYKPIGTVGAHEVGRRLGET